MRKSAQRSGHRVASRQYGQVATWAAAFLTGACLASAGPAQAAAATGPAAAPTLAWPGNAAWAPWSDSPLVTLLQNSPARDATARQQQVQAWLALYTTRLRTQLLLALVVSAHQEQSAWMNQPPAEARDAALAAAGQKVAVFETQAAELAQQADEQLAALALRSGLHTDQLNHLLVPWVQEAGLPLAAEQLPAAVLAAQVPQPLALFGEPARRLAAGQQWVSSRRLAWQARQQRQALGAGDEADTVLAYQQFLVDSEALVASSGQLASAWALWLHRQAQGQAVAASSASHPSR